MNARHREQEAFIIAQAGAPGAVTIATNMAGRGTDIQLGGNVDMLIRQKTEIEDDVGAAVTKEVRAEVQRIERNRWLPGVFSSSARNDMKTVASTISLEPVREARRQGLSFLPLLGR